MSPSTPEAPFGPSQHFAAILKSEFCKFRSVRSTLWMLIAAVVFNIGLAALLAIFLPAQLSAHDRVTLDATRVSLGGIHLSQVAVGLLGVLVISSEYTTGMIRASLSAVPKRRQMLAAKAIVFAAASLAAGICSSFAAFFVFQGLLTDGGLQASIGDPGVLRALVGGGLYLTALGLLGLGLGAILRSSAGAVATLLGVLFVPSILVELLPESWKATVVPYVPMQAGSTIFSAHREAESLGAWSGFGVFCLYGTIALVVGFVLIGRRDA